MSHTNETPNYGLPQYVGTDILNPLVDTNDAYEKIDTALKNLADDVVDSDTRLDALESTVGDVNSGLVKDMNDVKDKIGDTPLTTSAQTLTGAIEEVKAADEAVADRVTVVENALPTKADTTDVVALGTRMTTAEGKITTLEGTVGDANSGLVKSVNSIGGKSIKAYNNNIRKTCDGVKTFNEYLNEMLTELRTYMTENPTDYIHIANISVRGFYVTNILPNSVASNNSDIQARLVGATIADDLSGIEIREIKIWPNTVTHNTRASINVSTSTVTASDFGANVFPVDSVIDLHYRVYREVITA